MSRVDSTENGFKTARDDIYVKLLELQTDFKEMEAILQKWEIEQGKAIWYLFDEFQRHGQEFIDEFTDARIEELYKK